MRTSIEDQERTTSRRALLRGGAGVAAVAFGSALSGCGLFSDDPPPAPPPADPLAPLLAGALELVDRYDAALAAHPDLRARLGPVRAAHLAHAAALARLTGAPAPSGSPSPGATRSASPPAPADRKGTVAALRAAEQAGRRAADDACLAAPPERAATLGSIAAARATHLEVLA